MINLRNKQAKLRYQAWLEKQMNRFEKRFANAIYTILKKIYTSIARKIAAGSSWISAINEGGRALQKECYKQFKRIAVTFFDITKKQVRIFQRKDMGDEFARAQDEYLKEYTANLISNVKDTTKKRIKRLIERDMEAQKTNREIAKHVLEVAEIRSRSRANAIARTETHSIATWSMQEAALSEDSIAGKEWLTARDDRVRSTHVEMDGIIVGIDDAFEVPSVDGGIDEMQQPGDPNGSAGNTINCRCVLAYVTRSML